MTPKELGFPLPGLTPLRSRPRSEFLTVLGHPPALPGRPLMGLGGLETQLIPCLWGFLALRPWAADFYSLGPFPPLQNGGDCGRPCHLQVVADTHGRSLSHMVRSILDVPVPSLSLPSTPPPDWVEDLLTPQPSCT